MEEQPLDLSMAGTRKKQKKTMNPPKAELIIESLYKIGHDCMTILAINIASKVLTYGK